jgi:hypothetical protein
MARRAKPLNQFAYLQLLQRCAASCRRGRASRVLTADLLQKSGVLDPPAAPTSPPESQDCANKLLFVRSLSHSSRSLARALTSPRSSHDRLDSKKTPTPDTRQLSPAVAEHRAFRCEAYSDKGKCQYNRCVQQTRGSYLSRDGCDAQMMSFSLGGDPSELLLPIGQRWSWRTSRSVKGAVPVRHSRLT